MAQTAARGTTAGVGAVGAVAEAVAVAAVAAEEAVATLLWRGQVWRPRRRGLGRSELLPRLWPRRLWRLELELEK